MAQRWNRGLGKSGGCGNGAGGGRARRHATSQHATAAATATSASNAVNASATASPAADTHTSPPPSTAVLVPSLCRAARDGSLLSSVRIWFDSTVTSSRSWPERGPSFSIISRLRRFPNASKPRQLTYKLFNLHNKDCDKVFLII